eukprot:gnl/TRDRNA2_/TRDRNA2_115852_c1_seq1.p1 gnl/TRDRNA2_/TRDRNA2_115852_c1~~gnl/TRDRNA2_/TRDRNA2_115852_c1_seq1.p1  ORF type:complete len:343 (+),score=29.23 gnl/TRDRNA2_/TRDRNA2_115852_c1_seq1:50-1030(+)
MLEKAQPELNMLAPPAYWTGNFLPQGWTLHPLRWEAFAAVCDLFRVRAPSELGCGRDAHRYHRTYCDLKVHCAWRIEHTDLWHRYVSEKRLIARHMRSLKDCGVTCPLICTKLDAEAARMPGRKEPDCNEVFFLHGTKPQLVLPILHNGFNDRMTKAEGAFGAGIYLAEDPEKIDQYGCSDSKYEAPGLEDLHARLYRPGGNSHPDDDLFYCFVVRAACGATLTTKGLDQLCAACRSGGTWSSSARICAVCGFDRDPPMADCDTGAILFETPERRELIQVPGSVPPIHFHSLLVETGKAVKRFRECIIYDANRIYAEYLLAYRRVS